MTAVPPLRTLTQLLDDLRAGLSGETVSVGRIIEAFHERGFGFLLFLFALPAALPLPAVGLGTVLGVPLLLLTAQMTLGRHTVWMPQAVRRKTLSRASLEGFVDAARPWAQRLERVIRPRLGWLTHGAPSRLVGLFGFVMSVSVLLPVPLTNTVPSMGIALMAVGILMRDGLAVLAGAALGTVWISALVFLGQAGLRAALSVLI